MKILSIKSVILQLTALAVLSALADATLRTNPPSECSQAQNSCGCSAGGDDTKQDKGTGENQSNDDNSGNSGDGTTDDCIKVWLGLGRTTPWSGLMGCSLKIFADDEASDIFTTSSIYAVLGGYTYKRLGQKTMADGYTPAEVVFSHPRGEPVHFVFGEGEAWGRPDPGVHIEMDERLMMVDAEGWATTSDPVYYDLYVGDGTRRRFLATNQTGKRGSLVSITDAQGVTFTPEDMGVDLIYAEDGALEQYLTPSRLANITYLDDWSGYNIDIYALAEKPAKDSATGHYILPVASPVKRMSLRSANNGKRAIVTIQRGDNTPEINIFDYAAGEWSLTRHSGVKEEKERSTEDMRRAQIVKAIKSRDGKLLSRRESNFKWESWGFAMTNRVEGFGGVTSTTEWTYYRSGNGKGQVKSERRQSGLLIEYAYDSEDRMVYERRSGPDMMTEVTTYAYTSVDPMDVVPPVDDRPRTVVKTLDGIECERTYYVYSPLTNIVERVGEQGAAYGGTNVLRTVTVFYPVVSGDIRSGFVKSIRHENGKIDAYDYLLESNKWERTVTHLHELAPEPLNGKTTREITVSNARGEVVEERTEAFVDNAWHIIARERLTRDIEGRVTRRENLAGQMTTIDWDCCHKVCKVQPDGSTTTWDYDDEGRMIAASRLIPLDMTNVTWLATCYEYDDLGRQTATWQTNYAAQVGLPATRIQHDALGRVTSRLDQLGNTTTTAYSADGRIVSVLNPNTSTRITTRSASGDLLSITGTAVTPEFHTFCITNLCVATVPSPSYIPCRVHETRFGSASSPRFTKRYENMFGQTIREERSGFLSAILATAHGYDSLGRLTSTVANYEPTVDYTYDMTGNRIATVRSAGDQWRKTETQSLFIVTNGVVWLAKTNVVSCSDAAIAPLVTASARQLTGLNSHTPLLTTTTDIRGNTTENWLSVTNFSEITCQRVPYATNIIEFKHRYGIPVMDISVSAVTNTYAYDSLGRQIAHTDGRGNTRQKEYNAYGQLLTDIDALGNRTTYAYDQFGSLSAITNPLGNATVYEYDLRGRKTYEGGATYPVRYTYDIFGNKTTMMTYRDESLGPDSGDVTTWLYDEASNCMTNKIYADGKGPTYSYTPNGNLATRTWARGIVTTYSYDGWNNLTNTTYSDDTPTVSLSYDALGRQIEAHDAAGVTTFVHDSFGSLTNETVRCDDALVVVTNTIDRFYDAYGRDAGYALNGTRQTTIGYDSVTGRIVSMLANGSDIPFTWSYLPGSDLKSSLTYPNGIVASWQYDANNQLLQVCNATQTSIISQYDYTYDAAGRRVQIGRSGSAMSENRIDYYGYNGRNELTNAVKNATLNEYAYQYDDIGNRLYSLDLGTNRTYTVNSLNQYTQISNLCDSASLREEFIPQFDDDGNQTLIKTSTGAWSTTYNGENRPVLWECGATNITMKFDRMGRRVEYVETANGITNMHHRFVCDGYLCIQRLNAVSNNAIDLVFGWDPSEPVATRPLIMQKDHEYNLFYLHDGNKNVSELVFFQQKNGIAAHYEYASFGAMTATNRNTPVMTVDFRENNPFRFSCECEDISLGVAYYNYRHRLIFDGRWSVRDMLSEIHSVNLYSYLDNYAMNKTDSLGLVVTHAECIQVIGNLKNTTNEKLQQLRTNIKGNGCSLPKIRCSCERNPGKLGSYNPGGNVISLYIEADGIGDKFSMESILIHEYTHALDNCARYDLSNDCGDLIFSELRAYYNNGDCFPGGARYNSGAPDLENCLKKAAKGSAIHKPCCQGRDFEKLLREEYAHFALFMGL